MTPDTSRPDFRPLTADEVARFRSLATALRVTGVAQWVCGAALLFLAFTGYDTPKPVNGSLLFLAAVLVLSGGGAGLAGQRFGRAVSGSGDTAALVEAIRGLASGNWVVAVFFCLAALAFVATAVGFFGKITGLSGG